VWQGSAGDRRPYADQVMSVVSGVQVMSVVSGVRPALHC
jgi:hypothetical protein